MGSKKRINKSTKKHNVKAAHTSKFDIFIQKIKLNLKRKTSFIAFLSKHKKTLLLSTVAIFFICVCSLVIWQWPEVSWLVRSSMNSTRTYPYVDFLGVNLGDLDKRELEEKLTNIKSDFGQRSITLLNGDNEWSFKYEDLGASFDPNVVSEAINNINSMSFFDKYNFLLNNSEYLIESKINVDNSVCSELLSTIKIEQSNPADALFYYDQSLKIRPDQSGTRYDATTNCREMPTWIEKGITSVDVVFDEISPTITEPELQAKLEQVDSLIGEGVSINKDNYHLSLTSADLLALLDIYENDEGIQIKWSSDRLDNLVNNVASNIDVNNPVPTMGVCQYLINSGGYWLNRDATKNIFLNLGADSARSYDLQVDYHEVSIGTRNKVPAGNAGVIYLTYDDGMAYAGRIMDYAACYGVKVTFFEIGSIAWSEAAQLRRAVAEGHAVQSHGFVHAAFDYGTRSYDWQNDDIRLSIETISAVTGVRPTYFRPPGGNKSDDTYRAAANNGVNLIMWGDPSRDATQGGLSSSATCANVLAGAYSGASVLMHSTHSSTSEAMPCIVEGLAAMGYNMVALR